MSKNYFNKDLVLNANKMYVVFSTAYLILVGFFSLLLLYERNYTLLALVGSTIIIMAICLWLYKKTNYSRLPKVLSFTALYSIIALGWIYYGYGPQSFVSIILALIPAYLVLVTQRKNHFKLQIFHFLYVLIIYLFWVEHNLGSVSNFIQNKDALYITIMVCFLGTLLSLHVDSLLLIYERQNEELNDSRKRLGVFLSDVSHQIKTPLMGLIGIQSLQDLTESEDEEVEVYQILRMSSYSILRDLNNILELSKLEGNLVKVNSDFFSLDEMLEDIMYVYKNSDGGEYYKIDYKPNGKTYFGDKKKIKLILENIFDNAFSDHKAAQLSIYMDPDHEFRLHVIDPHKGGTTQIEKTNYDDQNEVTRNNSSLGLYLSRCLARLLKGDLEIEETHAGNHYILDLAYRCVEDAPVKPVIKPSENRIKNVLLVEDNAVSRKIISSYFIKAQYHISTAENGLEAYEYITRNYHDIDIIFMDIQMPVMDGNQATKMIRSWETQNTVNTKPIIALTANTMFENKLESYSSGITYFMSKPFNPQKVELLISKLENNKEL